LEIAEPEAVARAVLARISTELLPGLHALFAAKVKASDAEHRRFHLARMAGAKNCALASDCVRSIERSDLAVVRDLRKRVHTRLLLQHYIDLKISDVIERGRLSTEVADLVINRFITCEPPSYAVALALLAKVEAAAAAFPWDHRI